MLKSHKVNNYLCMMKRNLNLFTFQDWVRLLSSLLCKEEFKYYFRKIEINLAFRPSFTKFVI